MRAKARVKTTLKNPKENQKEPKVRTKVPKACTGAKTSKFGLSGRENSKQEASSDTQESAQTCTTNTSWNDGRATNLRSGSEVSLDGHLCS